MSLESSLADEKRKQHQGLRCPIAVYLETATKKDAQVLTDALGDPEMKGTVIHRALKREGVTIPVDTVRKHRNGECQCRGSV